MNRIELPGIVRPAEDLDALAAAINAEHEAVELATRQSLEHARKVGDLLLRAQQQVEGHNWLKWLKKNTRVPERTAQHYIRIVRNWDEIGAKSANVADMGVVEAVNLIAGRTPDPAPVPDLSAWSFVCEACGEQFDKEVWHCPVCAHHWPMSREECWNCHKGEQQGSPVAVDVGDEDEDEDPQGQGEWTDHKQEGLNAAGRTPLPTAPESGRVGKPDEFITIDEWKSWDKARRQRFWEVLQDVPSGSKAMNRQDGDSIEWSLWSWNPVTGCKHDCPYCYARDIAERIYTPRFEPALWPGRLDAPSNVQVPRDQIQAELAKGTPEGRAKAMGLGNVFVCSMADLFGRWVPKEWIDAVLKSCAAAPQWNFLFLTKFPIRMAEFEYPDNCWLGTSVDCQARVANAEKAFRKVNAAVKWLSCEPLIEPLHFADIGAFDWVVLGGASRSSQTPEWHPPRSWVNAIEAEAAEANVRVYEKTNLLSRIRQYPGVEGDDPTEAPEALRYLATPEKAS